MNNNYRKYIQLNLDEKTNKNNDENIGAELPN